MNMLSFDRSCEILLCHSSISAEMSVSVTLAWCTNTLIWMLIHVCKIFNCTVSFKCCCQGALKLFRKSLSIAVMKYFQNYIFEENLPVMEVLPTLLFSLTNVSKQKIKMKTWNTIAPSNHLKITSTLNKILPFFFCLAHGV